ncbi:hypothetical protein N8D56_21990 [Devosia sp. A8/3-2]|nr:hypothetical protein N8D56_21990 [Devosia sp. A8/3-2]
MNDNTAATPVLAVFASDKGPGDAERASLMSQTGTYFARRRARIICPVEKGVIPVPLITAARAAGGHVQLIADASIVLPSALAGVAMEVIAEPAERIGRVAQLADAPVALPGSLASVSNLFGVWTAVRAGAELPGGDAQPAQGL